jgi:SPP1 gp7 family putative phage head morphogenesis protein|nr:MAG TPA: minor capsid protein [Caudoviricetes sp.]
MDKKSKEYWEKRARENENKVYKKASDLKKELDVHYIQAKKEIQKSINDLIARYMFKTDLSYADAMKYLTSKEFKEFRMSLEEYEAEIERLSEINEELANKLRIELETLAMKSRITRLDSLKTQIDIELSKKISNDYNVVEKGISEVYRDFFKIQTTDFGLTGVNTVLPKKTLKMLMQQPWSGANFSERIWGNSEALGKVLKQEIIQSFMQGVSVKDLSDRIEKRFENDRYNTERLVRTELNYAFNQTTKLSYEEAEIEEYEFLAEIDSRTSEICKKLNGEKFKVKDARAGVNYPPMHPHCRSTTVAVLDFDNFGKEKDKFEEKKKEETKLEKNDIIKESYQTFSDVKAFWKYISKEEKRFVGTLTIDEKGAIRDYTGSGASRVNRFLRDREEEIAKIFGVSDEFVFKRNKKDIENLRNAIAKFELEDSIVTYRAQNIKDAFEDVKDLKSLIGTEYNDRGFMSTTPVYEVVNKYAKGNDKDLIFEIKLKKGKGKGAYINSLSGFKNIEYEFLLKDNMKFTITDVYEDDYYTKIRMVEKDD